MTLSIQKQLARLVPPRYRNAFWLSWLWALLSPAQDLHADFLAGRSQDLIDARYSSMVLALEALCRSRIHPEIFLVWRRYIGRTWVYAQGAPFRSVTVYPAIRSYENSYIYRAEDYDGGQYHLEVRYPLNASIDLVRLRSLIERYLHVGFRYTLTGIIINPTP